MTTFLTVVHFLVCVFLILTVLLQAGRGGGMGAAFGGSSQTVFGGAGAGNFLQKLTVIMAAMFMILSASLAYISSGSEKALEKAAAAQKLREEARKVEEDKTKKAAEPGPASTPEGETTLEPPTGATTPTLGLEGLQLQGSDGQPIKIERVDGLPPGVAPAGEAAPVEAAPAEAPAAKPAKPAAAPAPRKRAAAAAPAEGAAPAAAVDPTPPPAAAPAPTPEPAPAQ